MPPCNPGEDALRWDSPDPGNVAVLTPVEDPFNLGGQRARALNTSGEIVDSGFDTGAFPCTRIAGS